MSESSCMLHNSFLYWEKLSTKLQKYLGLWILPPTERSSGHHYPLFGHQNTPVSIHLQQLAKSVFLLSNSPLDMPWGSRISAVWVLVNQIGPEGHLPPASDFTSMGTAFLPSRQLFCRADAAQTLKLFSTKQKLSAAFTSSSSQSLTTGKAWGGSSLATKPRH